MAILGSYAALPRRGNADHSIALVAVAVLLLPFVVLIADYFLDPFNLRLFPSPSYAAISSLWLAFKGLRGQRSSSVHEAHLHLGPIIRIQPTHLSFNSPQALHDIYGHGSNIMKADFYDTFESENVYHTVATKDRAEHARKRKNLASAFAMKNVIHMEPVVRSHLSHLMHILDQHARSGTSLNIRRWLNLLTFDIASELAFGEDLGFLKSGNDEAEAETTAGRRYRTQVLASLHANSRYDVFLAHWPSLLPLTRRLTSWHPGNIGGGAFIDVCVRKLRARMERASCEDAKGKDFFQSLLFDKEGSRRELPFKEMVQEATVMLNAGSDPMATVLVNALYLVMKNPQVLERLRGEIEPVFQGLGDDVDAKDEKDTDRIAPFRLLERCKYLRACIDEAMRLRPSSALGLPRKTPPSGSRISGHSIAGGVTVSVPTYTLHHSPVLFSSPEEYRPERWLGEIGETAEDREREVRNCGTYVIPFSFGARACVGRNVAYLEFEVVLASLVWAYEFEFVEGREFVLGAIERFNTNPGDMEVWVRPREGRV
jgi:cytochrome P450